VCDGSAVSRTTYASLFAAIGTTFGAGDGATTFNLPDLRGRVAIGTGQGAGLTNRALGATGGEEGHVLVTGEMPSHSHSHTHTVTDPKHSHPVGGSGSYVINWTSSVEGLQSSSSATRATEQAPQTASTGITLGTNAQATGGGAAHNTMQPFLALTALIKT
jgi:microcystin-dependent protein